MHSILVYNVCRLSVFDGETLLEPKPVKNWPKLFGRLTSVAIRKNGDSAKKSNVLVVNGGAGRTTLELLRSCDNLLIDHSDSSASHVKILNTLLKESTISWDQPIEGEIFKKMTFTLEAEESAKDQRD